MLTIRIKGAELTRDTQAIGSMIPPHLTWSPYILVRNLQKTQLKRTTVSQGKNPIFQDSFSVPLRTPQLQFIVLSKSDEVLKKLDDVVGGGVWNCHEVAKEKPGIPFQVIVPISYRGVEAGRVVLEVVVGEGMQGGGGGGEGMEVAGEGGLMLLPPLEMVGSNMGAEQMGFSSGGYFIPELPGGAPHPMAANVVYPVYPIIGESQFASGAMVYGSGYMSDSDEDLDNLIITKHPPPIPPPFQQLLQVTTELSSLRLDTSKVIELQNQLETLKFEYHRANDESIKYREELGELKKLFAELEKKSSEREEQIRRKEQTMQKELQKQKESMRSTETKVNKEIEEVRRQRERELEEIRKSRERELEELKRVEREGKAIGQEGREKEDQYNRIINNLKQQLSESKLQLQAMTEQYHHTEKQLSQLKSSASQVSLQHSATLNQLLSEQQQLKSELLAVKKQYQFTQSDLKNQIQQNITKSFTQLQQLQKQKNQTQSLLQYFVNLSNSFKELAYSYESGRVGDILKKIYEKRRSKIAEGKRANDYADLTQALSQTVVELHAMYAWGVGK